MLSRLESEDVSLAVHEDKSQFQISVSFVHSHSNVTNQILHHGWIFVHQLYFNGESLFVLLCALRSVLQLGKWSFKHIQHHLEMLGSQDTFVALPDEFEQLSEILCDEPFIILKAKSAQVTVQIL